MTTFPVQKGCTLLEEPGEHRVFYQALRGQARGAQEATKEPFGRTGRAVERDVADWAQLHNVSVIRTELQLSVFAEEQARKDASQNSINIDDDDDDDRATASW